MWMGGHPGLRSEMLRLRSGEAAGIRSLRWAMARLCGAGEGYEADVVFLAEELGGVGEGLDGG